MLAGPGNPVPESDRGSVAEQPDAGNGRNGPGGRAGTMSDENGPERAATASDNAQGALPSSDEVRGVPSGRSKEAHAIFNSGDFVFISLDVETAGEDVGVVQLSAEISRLELVRNIKTKGKYKGKVEVGGDTATNIQRDPEVFNEFVKPAGDHEWSAAAIAVHGLTPTHPSIVGASDIATVWENFVRWVDTKIDDDETGILVAWHGEACDMKWIWKLTQAPGSTLHMPDKITLFMDPEKVIREKKSCKLHHCYYSTIAFHVILCHSTMLCNCSLILCYVGESRQPQSTK